MVKRILKWLVVLPLLALFVVIPASSALAADLRSGDTIVIASGDVINDDLYIAARKIVINGTVNGDVLCVGDTTVNGKINGSITAIGASVIINGEVTQAVRIAGGSIDIGAIIGKDVMVAGENIQIANTSIVGRDLVFAASKIRVDALIENSIKGYSTRVDLSNGVGGDVDVGVNNLLVESTANINGNLVYSSKNEATILSGARIGGTITHNMPEVKKPIIPLGVNVWFRVIAFLMTLVTGGLIILLVPKRASAVAVSIKNRPWLSLGWGALILVATPIAVLITFITIVGIPIGLIGTVTYIIAIYLSQIAVGLFLGYWILGYFSKVESRGILLGAFALGLIILTLIQLIPYIGPIFVLATIIFGLGAMALSQKTLREMETERTIEITAT